MNWLPMLRYSSFFLMLLIAFPSFAVGNIYGILSAAYVDTESAFAETDGVGYKFGVGYEFHRQWYVEAGYHLLSDDSLSDGVFSDSAGLEQFVPEVEAESLFISVLGKASSRAGELFYRLGVNTVDVSSTSLIESELCDGRASDVIVAGNTTAQSLCLSNETVFAGHIGLGFDFRLGRRLMLRTEAEYLKGEDDVEATSLTVGLRYNF
jgi:outer membrane autotransporter protein